MALLQTIVCSKNDPSWSTLTADQAHQLLIDDTEKLVPQASLISFQEVYAANENSSFNLSISLVNDKLAIRREWASESDYTEYKQAIRSIENVITSYLEADGWMFEESASTV